MPQKFNKDALPSDKLLMLYQRLTLDMRKHYRLDLARDLGCSSQTVTRLVEVIERHLGPDTFIEKGLASRRRFFQFKSASQSKTLGFDFEELNYLAMCCDLASPALPESVSARTSKTLTALALQLADVNGTQINGRAIGFRSKGYIDYGPHMGIISTLRSAIAKRNICRVDYRPTGQREVKSYRYAPGHILAMSGTLYVQGYRLPEGSLLPDRPTTFSLHRICAVEVTGEFFNFDAADTEARRFGLDWHEPRRVRVYIAPDAADYVRDRIWSDDQSIEEQNDGGILLTVTTTSEKELKAWVLGFGAQARLITDDKLIEAQGSER